MKLNEVGKVLFIDDDYETIAEVTSSFLQKNIQVQYWNGAGALPKNIYNARVVVTDLDLTDTNLKAAMGDTFFFSIVDAVSQIPQPFPLIFVAREFDPQDPRKFKRAYKVRAKTPFPGFLSEKGLTKAELNPTGLKELIDSLLENNEILELILTWETLYDKAKDSALNEISIGNVENSIRTVVKILCNNCHENKGATRELIDELSRLVSRNSIQNEDFENLVKIIDGINETQVEDKSTKQDLLLLSKLIFYRPAEEEEIMTGDIFETNERFKYAVILSPKCDLMQNKLEKALICYGFPLKKAYFRNKNYPPHKNDTVIVSLHKKSHKMVEIADEIEKRYLGKDLPSSLHVIWNFTEKEQGICLDLNNVQSIDLNQVKDWKKLKIWKRLCRIDSPYMEEILQKYGSLISRVGTLEIKSSPPMVQHLLKKIEKEKEKKKE